MSYQKKVESSFSVMGDVIDKKSGRMNIGMYSDIHRIKCELKTRINAIMQANMQGQIINQVQMQQVVTPMRNNEPRNVSAYRGLAITQLVIGVLNIIFGIAVLSSLETEFFSRVGTGVWNGIVILITGIIGLIAVKDLKNNACINGTYMAFSIVSTHGAFAAALLSIIGSLVWCETYYHYYCPHEGVARALFGILFLLNAVEFVISIIAAVFCCRNTACCSPTTQGVIISQPVQYQQQVAYPGGSANANIPQPQNAGVSMKEGTPQYLFAAYPQQASAVSYPGQMMPQAHAVSYTGQMMSQPPALSYQGQTVSQAPNGMMVFTQPQTTPGQVNVVYSTQHAQQGPLPTAPPPYSAS